MYTLHWRHNGHDSVSNHQPHDCLLNRLFRRRSKKTSQLNVTGLCVRNSPGTSEFPAQMASNAENVSIWWRHHVSTLDIPRMCAIWTTWDMLPRQGKFHKGPHDYITQHLCRCLDRSRRFRKLASLGCVIIGDGQLTYAWKVHMLASLYGRIPFDKNIQGFFS